MSTPDRTTTTEARPDRGAASGTWHWLKHDQDGEVQVMQWCGDDDDCWKMVYFDDILDASCSFGWTYVRPLADAPPNMSDPTTTPTTPDHPYFYPLPHPRDEALAAHLHRRWQEHEAEVAAWSNPTPRPWDSLEPDQQRGYRAMAVAALEFAK